MGLAVQWSQSQIKMGSTFSIHNDSTEPIYVWEGLNVDAILYSSIAALSAITLGAGGVAFSAGGAATAATTSAIGASSAAFGLTSEAGIAAALAAASAFTASTIGTTATVVGWVATASAASISTALGITKEQAETYKKNIEYFKNNCNKKLRPGQTYTSGKYTLSLTKTIWLMNSNGEQTKRAVWTGY